MQEKPPAIQETTGSTLCNEARSSSEFGPDPLPAVHSGSQCFFCLEVAVRSPDDINRLLAEAEGELATLDARRAELLAQIGELRREQTASRFVREAPSPAQPTPVTNHSSQEAKIALVRSLFRGREDVYARRFESLKTGKKGYQPVCRNEWVSGVCGKPKVRCDDCANRDFLPVTDDVVRNHLLGLDPQDRSGRDFTVGLYPMLLDETCWFLAVDLDKASWREDAKAFLETCRLFDAPAALERSRSGNGGHCWIFFSEPVRVGLARRMGAFLLTQTMERRPEIGLDSTIASSPARTHSPEGGSAASSPFLCKRSRASTETARSLTR